MTEGIIVEMLLDRASTSWDGATLEGYPSGVPSITIQRVTLPPHTKMAHHSHTTMNVGYILSGELTITTEGGTTRRFKAGETPIEVVGTIHYGENRGDDDCQFIAVTLE